MTYEEFVAEVQRRAGLARREEAVWTTRVVLESLPLVLVRSEVLEVVAALPRSLGEMVAHRESPGEPRSLDELVRDIQRREHVRPGFALEHAQVVFELVAELLPEGLRARLRRDAPPDVAELFEPRGGETGELPPPGPRHAMYERANTLASARPGSGHPVSEAAPETAHRESVARSDNPHEGEKLSSAPGLRQERRGSTLAEGAPAAGRRL